MYENHNNYSMIVNSTLGTPDLPTQSYLTFAKSQRETRWLLTVKISVIEHK